MLFWLSKYAGPTVAWCSSDPRNLVAGELMNHDTSASLTLILISLVSTIAFSEPSLNQCQFPMSWSAVLNPDRLGYEAQLPTHGSHLVSDRSARAETDSAWCPDHQVQPQRNGKKGSSHRKPQSVWMFFLQAPMQESYFSPMRQHCAQPLKNGIGQLFCFFLCTCSTTFAQLCQLSKTFFFVRHFLTERFSCTRRLVWISESIDEGLRFLHQSAKSTLLKLLKWGVYFSITSSEQFQVRVSRHDLDEKVWQIQQASLHYYCQKQEAFFPNHKICSLKINQLLPSAEVTKNSIEDFVGRPELEVTSPSHEAATFTTTKGLPSKARVLSFGIIFVDVSK